MKQGYENVASVLTPDTSALVCATDTLALGASKYFQSNALDICRSPASAVRR
jgi:LacI family trehalose operon transcriptional repressor